MGYRIVYGSEEKKNHFLRIQVLVALCLLVLVVVSYKCWPEATDVLRRYFLSNDPQVDNMEQLIWELETGADPIQAVGSFVQALLYGS